MPLYRSAIAGMAAALLLSPAARSAGQQSAASSADYVGEDTCLSCHPTQSYKGSAHALTTNVRTPAATQGCESCHRPGKPHVDGGGDTAKIANPATLPVLEANAICGKCHDRPHSAVDGSVPDPRAAGCATCHSVHAAVRGKLLKRARAPL
jgi:hypothetical protein